MQLEIVCNKPSKMYSRPWINILYLMYVLPSKMKAYISNNSLASFSTILMLCAIFLQQTWISVAGSPVRMEAALIEVTEKPTEDDLYQHVRVCRKAWLTGDF